MKCSNVSILYKIYFNNVKLLIKSLQVIYIMNLFDWKWRNKKKSFIFESKCLSTPILKSGVSEKRRKTMRNPGSLSADDQKYREAELALRKEPSVLCIAIWQRSRIDERFERQRGLGRRVNEGKPVVRCETRARWYKMSKTRFRLRKNYVGLHLHDFD